MNQPNSRMLKRWEKVHAKEYSYLNPHKIRYISKHEEAMLHRCKLLLSKKYHIHLNAEEIKEIWIQMKEMILKCIQRGHCLISPLQVYLYWAYVDKPNIFARLQAKPVGRMQILLRRIRLHFKKYQYNREDIEKATNKLLGNWIHFQSRLHY